MKILSFKYLLTGFFLVSFSLNVYAHDDEMLDLLEDQNNSNIKCTKATASQIQIVKNGNAKRDQFLKRCEEEKIPDFLCEQIIRPNPSSKERFICTYGNDLPHQLIDPDESTWEFAFQGAKIVMALGKYGVRVNQIYNWWRPEPYNSNVGGAPGRHPQGTSIDVRMAGMKDTTKALSLLCKWRNQKTNSRSLNAIGYYGNTGIHFGVGDTWENTWGSPCGEKN